MMQTEVRKINNKLCAVVHSDVVVIDSVQSALDFMMTIRYEHDCDAIVLNKEAFADSFFVLNSGIAGEILQKFVTYQVRLAIVGDFTAITSKALRDFIYESNQGQAVCFVADVDAALEKLGRE